MPISWSATLALVMMLAGGTLMARAVEAAAPTPASQPSPGATERWTEKRLYRVSWVSAPSPVPLLALHSWTVTIAGTDDRPVDDARLTVLGGMPAHSHGLPTTPAVTSLGGGRYLVEGLKFHMPGAWVVAFRIKAAAGTDSVSFPLDLP